MADPKTPEAWVTRLEELMEELDSDTVARAYRGNAAAKATVEAWAVEVQAAAVFLATYGGAGYLAEDALLETANKIIDTMQAILLALGIAYLLYRLKRKPRSKNGIVEITVTQREAESELGDRTKPIPSRDVDDPAKEAAFLQLRTEWTIYYLLTLMRGLALRAEAGPDVEFVWHAKLDGQTCSVCRAMDGERSIDGDFLPVLLKKFPKYIPYGNVMIWPHAHPRCRCWAEVD